MNTTISRLTAAASLMAICATPVFGQTYSQGFESDTSGFTLRYGDGYAPNDINRVQSGSGYVFAESFAGNFHAEILLGSETAPDTFATGYGWGVSWNDNFTPGAFVNGIGTRFSAYLDDTQYYGDGDGWFFHPTLMNSTATGEAISGGGFGVQRNGTAWEIAATGNQNSGFNFGLQHSNHAQHADTTFLNGDSTLSITVTDSEPNAPTWLTFETIWVLNGSNGIDQVNTIYDADDNVVYVATIANVVGDASLAGTLGSAFIGQYGYRTEGEVDLNGDLVVNSEMLDLAIDNVAVIPEPSTVAAIFGLVAAGLVAIRRRNHVS